ncbi:MAG: lipopolysaccharide heptosyltransferase II [Candidatus Latescibacteria bacterium]|nr:lipopolysaccharide heptosyltransferase II [Candidatus Latescibacterota bacterium]NIM20909.1 lipopolysaccharide heptosyltransferase II [Candidatus Latescibacterota bacterium]NIM65044.1 lipopolysaccharide heptosyltransferase II [Candidatus Latescibacterota bacterium]NIO01559.1 lipopolysaccharide heptosyltransferase II [Candidatus Latescibacterota bacterium]NIO28076.1 lipopolysaccharide heptosyltransferase II [Candidatus Latescibacterota bacterium]
MTPPLPKVIVSAPNWLGDAVMSLPLLGTLSATPGVRLSVMAPSYTARVFLGVEGIDELLVYSSEGMLRGMRQRARMIRRLDASAAVILPPSFSSAVPPFLARVACRVGFGADGRRSLLTTSIRPSGLREEHLSQSYLRLGEVALRHLGIESSGNVSALRLEVFDNERASLVEKLEAMKAPDSGYCLVVPGATYGSAKLWPEPFCREAVRRLARSFPVVLAGAPSEKGVCARIASGIEGAFDMSGETTLGELFALIEGADVLVSNDSGASHVAGSLGIPAVVIFGSTSPRWTCPLGSHIAVAREPVLCSPCFLRECPTHLECFQRISPEKVVEHVVLAAKKGSISA